MSHWKDQISIGLPRLAIILHDLLMVWVCWLGLHQVRYSIADAGLAASAIE